MIKVFGHKAPDSDSTGAALIWAWYLTNVRSTPAQANLLGEPNLEAAFMLRRWGCETPEIIQDVLHADEVVIVDTNNVAELPPSINDARILEVIDHHRLQGGLKTLGPINVTIRPLAATVTLMHELMAEDAGRLPDNLKGVMLTCILSDTLGFRSPTTTDIDRALATSLAEHLGIDIASYTAEMFAAKSDLSAVSDTDLLKMDSKEFTVGDTRLRISVLETTSPAQLIDRRAGLMAAMPAIATADGADEVLLFVVDILEEEATLLVPNETVRRIAEHSFNVEVTGDTVRLPGVVSRKLQIIPVLKA